MSVKRSQKILEDPVCDLFSLSSSYFIREAEMDSFVYARVDDILRRIREAIVSARVDNRRTRVCRSHRERKVICFKEEREYSCYCAGETVCARRVIRIIRRRDERLPIWIACGEWIVIVIT